MSSILAQKTPPIYRYVQGSHLTTPHHLTTSRRSLAVSPSRLPHPPGAATRGATSQMRALSDDSIGSILVRDELLVLAIGLDGKVVGGALELVAAEDAMGREEATEVVI